MKEFLVINVTTSTGISRGRVVYKATNVQDAEAFMDKNDKRSLDSFMVLTPVSYDRKGKMIIEEVEVETEDQSVDFTKPFIADDDAPAEEKSPGKVTPDFVSYFGVKVDKDDPNGIKDEMADLK